MVLLDSDDRKESGSASDVSNARYIAKKSYEETLNGNNTTPYVLAMVRYKLGALNVSHGSWNKAVEHFDKAIE